VERAGKHGDHTTQHDEGTAFRPGDYFSGLLVFPAPTSPKDCRIRDGRQKNRTNRLFWETGGGRNGTILRTVS
jgi:hypothetical protein